MVSPYPPMRGGISAYADQAVASLRERGHDVAVASPEPSDAEHVLDVGTPGAGRALAKLARKCDRLVVQFYPEMLGAPNSALWTRSRSLVRLARGLRAAPSSELCVHEVNYGAGPSAPVLQRLVRPIWNLADVVTVHTERERQDFLRAFGIDEDRIRVVSQGEHLLRRTSVDRKAARAALGLPAESMILLAIGFLQPNKGFDRAIRAFGEVAPDGARLFVVGSVWREDATSRSYVNELRRLALQTPGVELREDYLGDEDFDSWIVASDALVLPYREGWSSNVMERGLLYDRPVIMSRVGGMAEQGADRPSVTLVDDDAALVEVLRHVVDDPARNPRNIHP
jgi:glycosyltransferase involved in cell wall biosynthesis